MTSVMKALKLTQMENDLSDIEKNIKKYEGIINSTKIRSVRYKNSSKKKLIRLIHKRSELVTKITETIMLGLEV